MSKMTGHEVIILEALKAELSNKDTLNKVVTASYLVSEMINIFGMNITDFVIGYQNGLLSNNRGFSVGEISTLSTAGDYASSGYSKFFDDINGIMCDVDEDINISPHSGEAKALTSAVVGLLNQKKVPFIDNYNKAKAMGR